MQKGSSGNHNKIKLPQGSLNLNTNQPSRIHLEHQFTGKVFGSQLSTMPVKKELEQKEGPIVGTLRQSQSMKVLPEKAKKVVQSNDITNPSLPALGALAGSESFDQFENNYGIGGTVNQTLE